MASFVLSLLLSENSQAGVRQQWGHLQERLRHEKENLQQRRQGRGQVRVHGS